MNSATQDVRDLVEEYQGNIIRQVNYQASNQPQDFDHQLMYFTVRDSAHPGVRLSQASDPVLLQRLEMTDEPLPIRVRTKMSIRIQPEGCARFSVQKNVRRTVGGQPVAINHAQAVGMVADVVKAFISEQTRSETAGPFGPGRIELEDIVLVALKQVSVASLQPILLIRPRHLD